MRDFDTGRFIRLKATIDGTVRVDSEVTSARALQEADGRYRSAISELLAGDLRTEFDALFPPQSPLPSGRSAFGEDILESAERARQARERLLAIAGWLQGLVDSRGT
jgi:hypothetical protein